MLLIGWLIDYDSYLVAIAMLRLAVCFCLWVCTSDPTWEHVGVQYKQVAMLRLLLALPLALCVVQRLFLSLRYH